MPLRLDVFRRHGIFQPEQIERLQPLRQFDGVVDAELPVRVHRDHHFGADRFAHRAHHVNHPVQLL